MALLVAKEDTNGIQILSQWRSNEMYRNLHLTAEPIMKQFAAKMPNTDYTLAPSQLVLCHLFNFNCHMPITPINRISSPVNKSTTLIAWFSNFFFAALPLPAPATPGSRR